MFVRQADRQHDRQTGILFVRDVYQEEEMTKLCQVNISKGTCKVVRNYPTPDIQLRAIALRFRMVIHRTILKDLNYVIFIGC